MTLRKQGQEEKSLTSQLINSANNAITRGEKTAEQVIQGLEDAGYTVGESMKYSWKSLKPQK